MGLHAPPYDTQLDVAPKIDWETLTVQGQDSAHVGSTAVKEVIEEVQPHPLAARAHPREPRGRPHRAHAGGQPGQLVRRGHAVRAVVVELDGKNEAEALQADDAGESPGHADGGPGRRRRRRPETFSQEV